MEYRTVYQGGKGEIVEKKSRFIAEVFFGALGGGSHAVSGTDTEKVLGCKASLLGLCNRRRTRDRALQ